MTSDKLRAIVESEIAGNWDLTNAHGCDLRRCVIPPVINRFENFGKPGGKDFVELWVVLEEDPDGCNGYKIVYDEEFAKFGLACPGKSGQDAYLGLYGSFLETFDAM